MYGFKKNNEWIAFYNVSQDIAESYKKDLNADEVIEVSEDYMKMIVGTFNLTVSLTESELSKFDTPFWNNKMEQEGGTTKQDFFNYYEQKLSYDKAQRKLESDKQLAYQEELETNPNLTYEEFLAQYSNQSTYSSRRRKRSLMIDELVEPEVPESVQNFIDKYINGEDVSVVNTDLQKVQNNLRELEKLNNYVDCEDMKEQGVYEDYKIYREELKTYIERSNQGLSLLIEIPQPSEKLLSYINRRKEEGTL